MESPANQIKDTLRKLFTGDDCSYLIGQIAGFFRWVNNLIVEDREIESKA